MKMNRFVLNIKGEKTEVVEPQRQPEQSADDLLRSNSNFPKRIQSENYKLIIPVIYPPRLANTIVDRIAKGFSV